MSRLLGTIRPPPRVYALIGQRLEPVRLAGVLLVSAGTLLSARGAYSEAPTAEAGRCVCPQVYAPVVCSNGKTYPNQCVADCRRARDCEPAGIF